MKQEPSLEGAIHLADRGNELGEGTEGPGVGEGRGCDRLSRQKASQEQMGWFSLVWD